MLEGLIYGRLYTIIGELKMEEKSMSEPIYLKIMQALKENISTMEPNTVIPSERELVKRCKVSRMTVRKAINLLVEEGYLYRVQNIGTFVADTHLHKKITTPHLFQSFGDNESYRILNFKIKDHSQIAPILQVDEREQLIQIVRLNENKEKIAESVDEIYLNQQFVEKLEQKNIQSILEFSSKIHSGSIHQRFIPLNVPIQYANLLKLKINTPILCVESKIYRQDGKIFAYVLSYYHPSKTIEFTI